MRLTPSDPDIETLLRRIEKEVIDLQPDFQRGEVWGEQKQKRLIDTILRNWYIPPIHVIEHKDKRLEVLDGQQRLVAIRDFARGEFTFDGQLPPFSEELEKLDGCRFHDLPESVKTSFLRFPIRQYTIHDFAPGEPAELFFRLNQQVALSAAEQRNAFYGPVRDQVHRMAEELSGPELGKAALGFGNSRMAYDDVIARVCRTLEKGSILYKITAADLSDRYRSHQPFPAHIERKVRDAFHVLQDVIATSSVKPFRFNKPVLYSWLVFLAEVSRHSEFDVSILSKVYGLYADLVGAVSDESRAHSMEQNLEIRYGGAMTPDYLRGLTWLYVDRATSRVSDVFSVACRDIYLWLLLFLVGRGRGPSQCKQFFILRETYGEFLNYGPNSAERFYDSTFNEHNWGVEL